MAADAPVWALAFLLLVTALAAIVAAVGDWVSGEVAVGLAAAGLTLAGLLVAVLQWRAGLAEKAFDSLYNRIDLANQKWLQVDAKGAGPDSEDFRFFVFTELDSLEYAIRRYWFGLGMNEDIANRAVRHFRDRCRRIDGFREKADECVNKGGYFDETKAVVRSILAATPK